MRLFGGLFKGNCLSEEFVDEKIPDPEPMRFSYLSERGALRVMKLRDPVSGCEFTVDLNDEVAFKQLMCGAADCYI